MSLNKGELGLLFLQDLVKKTVYAGCTGTLTGEETDLLYSSDPLKLFITYNRDNQTLHFVRPKGFLKLKNFLNLYKRTKIQFIILCPKGPHF